MSQFLAVGIVLLLISLGLFGAARHVYRQLGIPAGRVIYSDTRTWQECPRPLYARSVNLVGKPDYLVKKWNYVIPIEVKTCHTPSQPYPSHVLQLAAYCLLVQETYSRRPPYGLIHYPDHTFSIPFTAELENTLLDTLDWMREDAQADTVRRNHTDPARCRSCGFAEYCDQNLT